MFEVRLTPTDFEGLGYNPQRLLLALDRIGRKAMQFAARDMRLQAPKAFSTLAQSIIGERVDEFLYVVKPTVNYAIYVFLGRRPGRRPPINAILDWVRVKRIGEPGPQQVSIAYRIANAIGRRGTRGQDFITPVVVNLEGKLPQIYREELRLAA